MVQSETDTGGASDILVWCSQDTAEEAGRVRKEEEEESLLKNTERKMCH